MQSQSFDWLSSHGTVCIWAIIPRLALFVIKTIDYGQDFGLNHKTKHKVAEKTFEQLFLKEFKAICKTSVESELKQQKAI